MGNTNRKTSVPQDSLSKPLRLWARPWTPMRPSPPKSCRTILEFFRWAEATSLVRVRRFRSLRFSWPRSPALYVWSVRRSFAPSIGRRHRLVAVAPLGETGAGGAVPDAHSTAAACGLSALRTGGPLASPGTRDILYMVSSVSASSALDRLRRHDGKGPEKHVEQDPGIWCEVGREEGWRRKMELYRTAWVAFFFTSSTRIGW